MSDVDRPSIDDQIHKARTIQNSDRDTQSKIAKAAFVIKKRDETIKSLRAEIDSLHIAAKEYRRTIFDLGEKLKALRKAAKGEASLVGETAR